MEFSEFSGNKNFQFVLKREAFNSNRIFNYHASRYVMSANFLTSKKKLPLVHSVLSYLIKALTKLLALIAKTFKNRYYYLNLGNDEQLTNDMRLGRCCVVF